MRYYQIEISDPDTGKVLRTFTSYQNGMTDPGALDIEMDIPVTSFASPAGSGYVRVWGISLLDINQSANFNPTPGGTKGKTIAVYGGMKKGLPLANPQQSGLLVTGTIFQAFGNWIGTDMTLEIIFTAGNWLANQPNNLTVNWPAGTPLSTVITQTLAQAFPGVTSDVKIKDSLVLPNDEQGFYGSLTQFAQYIRDISIKIVGGSSYLGVQILVSDNTFKVFDGSTTSSPKAIVFTDLIGQITWRSLGTVQLTCVMRYDLRVGDIITLPPGQVTTTAQSFAQYRQKSAFTGNYTVSSLRHVGRFRNPSGESWVTVVDAVGPLAA